MKFLQSIYSQIKPLKPPYPGLRHKIDNGKETWAGLISINARFDSVRVRDMFEVHIELPTAPNGFPLVSEIGGRIEKILSEGKANNLADLHVNPNKTICLCPKPEEKRRFPGEIDLPKFIQDLVIPYFFALHQFEKTGRWIWGQYSHGGTGIMEYYFERRNNGDPKLLEDCLISMGLVYGKKFDKNLQINGREPCVCGSGAKFKKCHPLALSGLKAIIEDIGHKTN